MHDTLNRRVMPVAVALAVLLSTAVVAPPPLAAEPAADPSPATLTALATARVAALDAAALSTAQDAAPPATESKSFFKSPRGVAAVLLFAAGVTFTLVSKSRDRVKSPIRD